MQRDLVERAMGGDRDAFTELGRASIDRLYAIARLILRDGDLAEDATQEALIAAWRDLKGLRDPDKFEPWIGLDAALPAVLETGGQIGEFGRGERARADTPSPSLIIPVTNVPSCVHRDWRTA